MAVNDRYIADARQCLDKAKSGALNGAKGEASSCLDDTSRSDLILHRTMNREKSTVAYQESNLSEICEYIRVGIGK